MSEIVCDFWPISATLRKQWLNDWWQRAKPEPEPRVGEAQFEQEAALTFGLDV